MAIKIKGVTVIDDDRKGYFDTISVRSQTTGGTTIEVESTSPAFKIIQKGTGNAFVVEDELNDTTPFIIDSSGNVQISGNLVVNGTTATVNATNIALNDPILLLGGENAPTVNDGKDRGVLYRWHDGTNAKLGFFGFDRSGGNIVFWADAINTNEVISGTQGTIEAHGFKSTAGTGTSPLIVSSTTKVSNLNADLVDGINFSTPTQWGVTYASSSSNLSSTSAGSAGQLLRSSGSGAPSWTTATFPNTATTAGAILRADGSNWVATTATYPASAGAVGTILRATTTGFINSSTTYPDTVSVYQLLYASSSNTISGLDSASNSVLVTTAGGAPSFSSTLPQVSITTAVTVPRVFGSNLNAGDLQLTSTSSATKGTVYLGTAGDTVRLGNATVFGAVVTNDNFGRMTVVNGTAKQFLVANGTSTAPTFATRSPTINFTGDVTGSVTLTNLDGTFNVNMTAAHVHPTDTTRAAAVHGHAIADVSGLQAALDGKMPANAVVAPPRGMRIITASGPFIVPDNVTAVKVRGCGGGGGHGTAANGGTTSFGSYCSATGGYSTTARTGGTATGGDLNVNGGNGGFLPGGTNCSGGAVGGANGGYTTAPNTYLPVASGILGIYGSGVNGMSSGGGAGGYFEKYITGLTPGQSIQVTIGAGGLNAGSGICIVEW